LDLDLAEPHHSHEVELVHQRSGRLILHHQAIMSRIIYRFSERPSGSMTSVAVRP
jgi:hypothetical protein